MKLETFAACFSAVSLALPTPGSQNAEKLPYLITKRVFSTCPRVLYQIPGKNIHFVSDSTFKLSGISASLIKLTALRFPFSSFTPSTLSPAFQILFFHCFSLFSPLGPVSARVCPLSNDCHFMPQALQVSLSATR